MNAKTTMLWLALTLVACGRIPGDSKFQTELDDVGVAIGLDSSLHLHAACTSWQVSNAELADCRSWATVSDVKATSLDPDFLTIGEAAPIALTHGPNFSIAARGLKPGEARVRITWVEDGKEGALEKRLVVANPARVSVRVQLEDQNDFRQGYAVLTNTKLAVSGAALADETGLRLAGTTDLRVEGSNAAAPRLDLVPSARGALRVFAADPSLAALPPAFEVAVVEPSEIVDVQLVDDLWNPDGTPKDPKPVSLDVSLGGKRAVRVDARPMLLTASGVRASGDVTVASSNASVLDAFGFPNTTLLAFSAKAEGEATVTIGFDGRRWRLPATVRP